MTEDEIREKVARAMHEADTVYGSSHTLLHYLPLADAALSACGHAELIAALTLLLDNYPIRDDDLEMARAALKAGGS